MSKTKQKKKQSVLCQQCGDAFETSATTRVTMAFCKARCRKVRNKDLMTYVGPGERLVHFQHAAKAEAFLQTLPGLTVRLDLHKVLDTLEPNVPLPNSAHTCAISYVGPLTVTRVKARKDMQARIASGQLACGFLVYKRGPRKGTDAERNTFRAPGSKAWVNMHLPLASSEIGVFVDDGYDHYASVTALKLPNLFTVHFQDGANLLAVLPA